MTWHTEARNIRTKTRGGQETDERQNWTWSQQRETPTVNHIWIILDILTWHTEARNIRTKTRSRAEQERGERQNWGQQRETATMNLCSFRPSQIHKTHGRSTSLKITTN